MPPFLHVKFTAGRPPDFAGSLPFAHEVDPAKDSLPDSLKTDVQREGVLRYLRNNFVEGHLVHQVVHEREYDNMYALLTNNWRRSTGDGKLHLSLYIYQEDRHCATWHAYTDRSVSYSREGNENDPPPEGTDAYSTPEAMAAAAASRAASPVAASPVTDRPRFDRPAATPGSDDDEGPSAPPPVNPLPASVGGRSSRSSKKHRPAQATQEGWDAPPPDEEQPPLDDWIKPHQGESDASDDNGVAPIKRRVPEEEERSSRSSHSKKPARSESSSGGEDLSKPAYPFLKSKPLRQPTSRSPSRSPSPPPRSSRHSRRDRSASPGSSTPAPSRSTRRKNHSSSRSPERSDNPPTTRSPRRHRDENVEEPEKQRSSRSARHRPTQSQPPPSSRSPSRTVFSRHSSCSKRTERAASASPSPPPPTPSTRNRQASLSPERSASPPRHRSNARETAEKVERKVQEKVKKREEPDRSLSRSRSGSRSASPPPKSRSSRHRTSLRSTVTEAVDKQHVNNPDSRSPSPPPRSDRRSRSSPPRPAHPGPRTKEEKPKCSDRRAESVSSDRSASPDFPARGERGRSPPRPTAPPDSPPPLDHTPSWRSVSRNRHRRADDSDDDTLVRGDLVDRALDIPAGGEVSLLDSKKRSASKDRSSRKPRPVVRDEGFDPSEVEKPPPSPPPKPTAKAVLGEWFKSVGALLKTEGDLVAHTVEEKVLKVEVHEEEARAKRKEERKRRREVRAARRAEREVEEEERALQIAAEDDQKAAKRAGDLKRRAAELQQKEEKAEEEQEHALEELRHRGASRASRSIKPTEEDNADPDTKRRSSRHGRPPTDFEDAPDMPAKKSTPQRSSSRSARHSKPAEQDIAHVRSSRHRHRGSANVESPSELEEPAPAHPPARHRALSFSATVDAGLKNLRESVVKMVSHGGEEATADPVVVAKERGGRRRKIASDSEEEREKVVQSRSRQPSRSRTAADIDGEGGHSSRREKPPPPSAPSQSEFSDSQFSPPSSRHDVPPSPSTYGHSGVIDARSRRSSRRDPRPDTPEEPREPKRAQRRQPPPPSSVESDSELSSVPSRPSSRGTMRATSEEDTPAHKEAKRNAMLNSTTIPAETIRQLREEQFARGIRSVPASPAASCPPALPIPTTAWERKSEQAADREIDGVRNSRKEDKASSRQAYRQANYSESDLSEQEDRRQYESGSSRVPYLDHPPRHAAAGWLPAPTHGSVPPIPSPISPSDRTPYTYPLASAPLRPQPVKPLPLPHGGTAPSQGVSGNRQVPSPSSAGSSDEGDPSRYPSTTYRERRWHGYRTANSGSDVPQAVGSRQDRSSGEEPYTFPRNLDPDEDVIHRSLYRSTVPRTAVRTFERPSSPPSHQPAAARRAPSFSTTHPAYPADESEVSPSESEEGSLHSSRYGPGSSGVGPVAGRSRSAHQQPATLYSDDSASEGHEGGSSTWKGASASRTMVGGSGGRAQVGGSRTMVAQAPTSMTPHSSGVSRTMVSSASSRPTNRSRPSPSSPNFSTSPPSPSFAAYPPVEDRFCNAGPSGFSGFDMRGQHNEWEGTRLGQQRGLSSGRALGKRTAAPPRSGSSQMYGEAKVSRRTAKRLGL
ncbi:hypothetical protein JCM11251_004061 [Rhodosporidiobolus azoricus]